MPRVVVAATPSRPDDGGRAAKQADIDELERRLAEARAELGELRRVRSEQEEELARAAAAEQGLEQAGEALCRMAGRITQLEAQAEGLKAQLAETEAKRDELFKAVDADLQVRRGPCEMGC